MKRLQVTHQVAQRWLTGSACLGLVLSIGWPMPAFSQSSLPTAPSTDLNPNQNLTSPGANPLQNAPDAQIDQLQPSQPTNGPGKPGSGNPEMSDVLIRNALQNTVNRYPWIMDPTDRFTFSGASFRPSDRTIYTNFDVQAIKDGPLVNRLTLGNFNSEGSFYWILNDNRIVIETAGELGGIVYQGRSTDTRVHQTVSLIQSYGGYQFAIALPTDFARLLGNEGSTNNSAILTIAAEVENPQGMTAPSITINNPAVDRSNPNLTILQIPNQSNLFSNLDVANAPMLLQAYPTTNLQSLAEVEFKKGEVLPDTALQEAGIQFGSALLAIAPQFTSTSSSLPGIKVLQLGKFDNLDLLQALLDRSLSDGSQKLRYLNSLQWVPFGMRITSQTATIKTEQYSWYRVYASRPHNRTMIQYDRDTAGATFSQVFSNPGVSFTVSQEQAKLDGGQTLGATLGLMMGLVFEFINPSDINQALQAARQQYAQGELFSQIQTKATANERRQINRRLNSTLAFTNQVSGLEQLSGSFTLPSRIEPENSSLLQVRTGLYRRSALLIHTPTPFYTAGPIAFGNLRLNPDRIGPLGFSSAFVDASTLADNTSFAAQTLLTTPEGNQFLFEANSTSLVGVPIPSRSFALAIDRFELTRTEEMDSSSHAYSGALLLPAVEAVFSGTQGNLNYSLATGMWLNLSASSGFNVAQNQSRFQEPTLGLYANATISYTDLAINRDASGTVQSVIVQTPSLLVRWNSASSPLNPNLALMRYAFSYQDPGLQFTIVPSLQYSDRLAFVLPASLRFSTGLNLETYLEFGNSTYYRLEALQDITSSFSLGAYARNFTDVANTRIPGYGYGLKLRYAIPATPFFTDLAVGTTNLGLEVRLQGSLSF